jgi:cbb3-type cytochrome oxidase cytochrome c subunit
MLYRCLFVLACAGAVSAQTLENTVQPMLTRTCAPCHNEEAASSHGRDAAARHPCATCHMQTVAATETAFLKAGGTPFRWA